jgi:hypothetical protein
MILQLSTIEGASHPGNETAFLKRQLCIRHCNNFAVIVSYRVYMSTLANCWLSDILLSESQLKADADVEGRYQKAQASSPFTRGPCGSKEEALRRPRPWLLFARDTTILGMLRAGHLLCEKHSINMLQLGFRRPEHSERLLGVCSACTRCRVCTAINLLERYTTTRHTKLRYRNCPAIH